MPAQKKASSGTAKAAATKKKSTTAAAKTTAETAEAKPAKTTKAPAKQTSVSKTEEKKAPAPAKTKNVDASAAAATMATAESTKPVAEPKKTAPAPVPQATVAAEQPVAALANQSEFQRETFDEKVLDDFNAGNTQQIVENANGSAMPGTGLDLNKMGGMSNPQKISELPRKQKKLIREKRFGSDMYSGIDTNQLVATMEAEKQKRQERAQKFGLGDTEETQADKRKERIARFKAEQQGGASDGAKTSAQEEKEKQAARIARFGGNPESEKQKKGSLQFTLDDYKLPKQKDGNFLKKRHHKVKQHHNGGQPQGHFKKRFMKGHQSGPPQQGSHKFKGQQFKRAKHF